MGPGLDSKWKTKTPNWPVSPINVQFIGASFGLDEAPVRRPVCPSTTVRRCPSVGSAPGGQRERPVHAIGVLNAAKRTSLCRVTSRSQMVAGCWIHGHHGHRVTSPSLFDTYVFWVVLVMRVGPRNFHKCRTPPKKKLCGWEKGMNWDALGIMGSIKGCACVKRCVRRNEQQ